MLHFLLLLFVSLLQLLCLLLVPMLDLLLSRIVRVLLRQALMLLLLLVLQFLPFLVLLLLQLFLLLLVFLVPLCVASIGRRRTFSAGNIPRMDRSRGSTTVVGTRVGIAPISRRIVWRPGCSSRYDFAAPQGSGSIGGSDGWLAMVR